MKYRREVDGLRAFALLPVMLFHAGFRLFRGGFVGVDVFFVISGYLITSIILTEQHQGTFTLAGFYERRARRILPALFVVMIVSLPFALFWLVPGDLADFSQSVVAVSLYASNFFYFWKSGYFDPAAEIKPLLHTWSLAVEEQYYLIFPLFLVLAWRLGKKAIVGILIITTFVSLTAAQWASSHRPTADFFLLPTRCWEILLGAIVAFYFFQRNRTREGGLVKQLCGVIGVGLILLSIFVYDETTPFPSLYTLVPTVGAALILLFATEETLIAKLLGSRVMVGIGLISYSAYLWHQPLFAFARHRSIEEPPTLVLCALMLAALSLAFVNWKWVETPFRDRHRIQRRHVVLVGVLGSAFFIVIGLAGHLKNGYIEGLSPSKMKVLSYSGKYARTLYREGVCYLESQQTYTDFAEECRAGSQSGGVLLWGDSHAAALSIGLRRLLPDLIQYSAGGCPPLKDVSIGWRSHCREVNDFVMREVGRLHPKTIIMHASWISYGDYHVASNLARTVDHLKSLAPAADIVLVGGVPEWQPSLPRFMLLRNVHTETETRLETPLWNELVSMDNELEGLASTHGARFESALKTLCPNGMCLVVTTWQNTPTLVVWDQSHLTEPGSVLLARGLALDYLAAHK
jgi:peptidoglycan/LPS O-acetylase OafA/YrhL